MPRIPARAAKHPRRVCLVEGSVGVEAVYTIKSFDFVPGRAHLAEPVAVKRIAADTKRKADAATRRYVKTAHCALMTWEKFEQQIGHDLARSVRRSSHKRGIPICER